MSRAQEASDRAAEWLIRREDGDWSARDQQDFDAWIAESPGHRAAYLRLRHSWQQADRIGALGGAEAVRAEPSDWFHWGKSAAIAASMLVAVGLSAGGLMLVSRDAGIHVAKAPVPSSFGTAVGGRKQIGLADGSRVELNTATKIRAMIGDETREVWLDKGEAYFEVAHLDGRTFVVHAGNRTVTVLGTKFSVRRDDKDKIVVSVLEGRVRVADSDNVAVPAAVITTGDIAVAQGPSALFTEKAPDRVESALAWRDGMIKFDQQPLAAVAAEFNRYNPRPIVVRGARASDILISGAFPTSDPQAFVRLLRDAFGLHVDDRDSEIIISGG